MNEKIPEALAVLDRRIASLAGGAPNSKRVRTRAELIKARAAFADLIAACKDVEFLWTAWDAEHTARITRAKAALAAVEKLP